MANCYISSITLCGTQGIVVWKLDCVLSTCQTLNVTKQAFMSLSVLYAVYLSGLYNESNLNKNIRSANEAMVILNDVRNVYLCS